MHVEKTEKFTDALSKKAIRVVIPVMVIWLFAVGIAIWRIQSYGACASVCATDFFAHAMALSRARPCDLRLEQSYSQWALGLTYTDAATYIKTGLGFADGKGVWLKNISLEDPSNCTYLPYCFQAPATPVLIGLTIECFGSRSIFPYFYVVSAIYLVTALLVCILASLYVKEDGYIIGSGGLALLCAPVFDYDFGFGIFSSEPIAAPFVGCAFIAVSYFWIRLTKGTCNWKSLLLCALSFGGALALAAYCRDVYTTFAQFCFLSLLVVGVFRKGQTKRITLFVLIAAIAFFAAEHPWRARNKHLFGEYAMTASTYYAYSMWYDIWDDYKERAKWGGDIGIGLGNYLAPEQSADVLRHINADKKTGSIYSLRALWQAFCRRPLDALKFKLGVYDHLWFGESKYLYIYLWCLLSTLAFAAFLFLTRFRFFPGLWLFPLFLLCVSPLIDFQHRFAQPFFLFITPVAAMYALRLCLKRAEGIDVHDLSSAEG